MRERWTRTAPVLEVARDEAAELIRPALGDVGVLGVEPIPGGHSNTNIRLRLAAPPHSVVLRLYQRDPMQARKEAAISKLVSDKVPAPRYLHLGARDSNGQTYAIVEFVDGETLSSAAKHASESERNAMGGSVGSVLAAIHSFTFDQAGMLDSELKTTPFPAGMMLSGYLQGCFAGIAGERLGRELAAKVVAFARENEGRLEVWKTPARLTHFDFGGTNILVRSDGAVAGVVDWEFAAAASPAPDFGNLLRPPLGRMPAFAGGVEAGYRAAGGFLPPDWRELTRISDLGAWVEFLTRPNVSEQVIEDARRILGETISNTLI
jgi:aminoglycoside phosphotransferase (APT) family kinase protein